MAQLTQFSTTAFPPSRRFSVWVDCLRRFFGEVRATAQDVAGFNAWIESISERAVVVTKMRVGAQRIEHTESTIEAEHNGFVHVVFPIVGCFHIEQAGRSVVLEPGDWGIYDLSRSFRSITACPVELIVLAAPRGMIFNGRLEIDQITAQRFSSRTGSARIVKNFMSSLLEEQRTLSPTLRHDFATFALQLTRLSIMENAACKPRKRTRRVLRSGVETYIANHLRNADLSIEGIAEACRCSKRYIHKIFAAEGRTASQYILDRRLAGTARDLASLDLAHLSITDIAVSWGFNSSSSFSRVFRKHFHTSPRGYRVSSLETSSTPARTEVTRQ